MHKIFTGSRRGIGNFGLSSLIGHRCLVGFVGVVIGLVKFHRIVLAVRFVCAGGRPVRAPLVFGHGAQRRVVEFLGHIVPATIDGERRWGYG